MEEVSGEGAMCLPQKDSISPFLRNLLNQSFSCVDDLAATPSLVARLQSELETDHAEFRRVQARVLVTSARGVSYYERLTKTLSSLASEIERVRASTSSAAEVDDDRLDVVDEADGEEVSGWEDLESEEIESMMNPGVGDKELGSTGSASNQRAMVEELEALASEVARVERVRIYAESVLKLEQRVGDLEASVAVVSSSSAKVGNSASSLRITRAVKRMQTTEEAVAGIAHAGWNRLVSAVDLRLDKVAAILRPKAIGDHRGLLTTVGWPPPLSLASAGGDKLANPFLEMSEEQERKYCESFMALTILQAVQQGRRDRQLKHNEGSSGIHRIGSRNSRSARAPLWAVEELISPLASRAEPHFLRWTTKPELVFALAYRIAQTYVDDIDEFLQPLVDKAKLAGYSAREEWVFSLVGMVSLYLQTHVLPRLAYGLEDEGGAGSVGAALWLHIVDQALAFDNRMKSLAVRVLGLFQEGEDGQAMENLSGPVTLSISAIAERQEWLELWANLELKDVLEKLKAELQTDAAWTLKRKSSSFLGLVEGGIQGTDMPLVARVGEFRAPLGADSVLSSMSSVTGRCRSLSEPGQQYRFIKHGVMPIAREYYQELSRRCEEVLAVTSLSLQASMETVATCVNAARYCEEALKDWGENIFFLELFQMQQEDSEDWKGLDGSIFDQEIRNFELLRQDWVEKLVSALFREFEARCREYVRNKKRWIEVGKGNVGLELGLKVNELGAAGKLRQSDLLDEHHVNILKSCDVSVSLVDALAVLQSQLRTLQAALDSVNFFELWRNLATALDQLLMNTVVVSGAKFSDHGGWQFAADIQALFLVFKPYCARPSGFFKTLQDAVRLLTLPSQDAVSLICSLGSFENFHPQIDFPASKSTESLNLLKQHGVKKLPPLTAMRILNSRVLPQL